MGVLRIVVFAFLLLGSAWAMPAANRVHRVQMPDGTTLNVRTVGNEVFNYKVTEDGHVVARDSLGYFHYVGEDGSLTKVRAMEPSKRTRTENEYLSKLNGGKVVKTLSTKRKRREYQSLRKAPAISASEQSSSSTATAGMRRMPSAPAILNSGEKRALVILVQFSDVKFSSADPKADFEAYLNLKSYNVNYSHSSVRDYFIENSGEKFIPNFDVVGPITLPGTAYMGYGNNSPYGGEGARVALTQALDTLIASKEIDLTKYDNDGDQILDFVHMIYAGIGSNDTPQDSAIWPHMWDMRAPGDYTRASLKEVGSTGTGFRKVRYYVGPYACSNELDGVAWSYGKKVMVGVGPFIHEFGHLLGLDDFYSADPNLYTLTYWDVMDGGAYNCPFQEYPTGCSPPYYSAFERMYLGWMKAGEIVAGKDQKLLPISENTAMKLTNPKNADEFYLMEYRNRRGWDIGLPNHGMLIWHIDYNDSAWAYASINTAERMRVDIVEADGKANYNSVTGDVFPGTSWKTYTSFKNFVTWDGTNLGVALSNIKESSDYAFVSFDVSGESDYVESSSSEEPLSSSSQEEISSSSEDISVSSSSVLVVESSSSVEIPASSETQEVPESCSSVESSSSTNSDVPKIVKNDFAVPDMNISRVGGILQISGMPQGEKFIRIFSLNGNLLVTQQVKGVDFSLETDLYFGKMPVVIQVEKNRQVILKSLVR